MSTSPESNDPRLVRSKNLSTFAHQGGVYLYHDLYGYILQMSPDILEFLGSFASPVDPAVICSEYAGAFGDQTPESFVGIFIQFGCLLSPGQDERDGIWETFPVRSRWNVHRRDDDGAMTFFTAWGERPVARHRLEPAEVAIWDAMEERVRLSELAKVYGAEVVGDLVARLVHHDLQALKLSRVPLDYYRKRPQMKPPYLTSTMPYAPYDPASDPAPEPLEASFSPEDYYRHAVEDADRQFDHQETTLSHLFRVPHPALGGRTYGQALVDGLTERERIPAGKLHVLEIGGGLGYTAHAVVEALTARGIEVDYDIIELSPTLASAQRERCDGLPVTVHEGEVLTTTWPEGPYDLIISNEMAGDLPAVQLTHEQVGLDRELDDDAWKIKLAEAGEAGALVLKYTIPIGDAPDPFYLNTGAMRLVERIADHLAPGGTAVITEFGEMSRYPVLSTHLDHPELSTHFGHLSLIAKELGLESEFVFVMDLIDLDRAKEGMATTRSYFRALKAMLAEHDVALEKVGYTREMFEELLAGKLPLERAGDFYFEEIENRLMGLVPHEFKALLITRPV